MHFYTLMPMIACCWLTLSSVSAQTLTLQAAEVEAAAGGVVCVDIKAGAFRKIIAMQYTLRWDPGKLQFQGVEGFRLPYLTEDNFGAHRSAEGILTFIWLDNSLRGVSLPDNSAIFQLCFQVRGKAGETAKVTFSQQPTPFEAVNAAEQVLGIKGIEGAVRIE
jgi:hypothetical protein